MQTRAWIANRTFDPAEGSVRDTRNPILVPGSAPWNSNGVADPSVLFDGTNYHVWFSANDGDHSRVGHAVSTDGVAWSESRSNPILGPGPLPENFDYLTAQGPAVLRMNGRYRMWYAGGGGVPAMFRIGLADSRMPGSTQPLASLGLSRLGSYLSPYLLAAAGDFATMMAFL